MQGDMEGWYMRRPFRMPDSWNALELIRIAEEQLEPQVKKKKEENCLKFGGLLRGFLFFGRMWGRIRVGFRAGRGHRRSVRAPVDPSYG
jgi:hypothetical protein